MQKTEIIQMLEPGDKLVQETENIMQKSDPIRPKNLYEHNIEVKNNSVKMIGIQYRKRRNF